MCSAWCIPTKEQFEELFKLDKKFIKNYNDTNVPGMLFTGENGNTLFLHAGNLHGRVIGGSYDTENGIYWANVIGFLEINTIQKAQKHVVLIHGTKHVLIDIIVMLVHQ